ncbi:MAG TPA: xanthine dehydrogenase, partial [Verrucomicrobia subdivision 3 bacterium]|nr:xanthine dehydrogenase [Limisphaerales bacterium]
PIRQAAGAAFGPGRIPAGRDGFAGRLRKPVPPLGEVEYEAGGERFLRPATLAGVLHALARFPEARLVAGATELGLDLTKRHRRFSTLVSVEAVPELREIQRTETEWRIGAAATFTQIEELVAGELPALADMLRVFGSRLIRNRAPLGGNLATDSPIGDSAPLLLGSRLRSCWHRSRAANRRA